MLVVVVSAINLALAALGILALDFILVKEAQIRDLQTQARFVAATVNVSLWFDASYNPEDLNKILSSNPSIIEAALLDKNGKVMSDVVGGEGDMGPAVYQRDPSEKFLPTENRTSWSGFKNWSLVVYEPITYKTDEGMDFLGTVYIRSDISSILNQVGGHMLFMGVVFLVSFGLAYVISQRFQEFIAVPLVSLAEKAAEVSKSGDYSLRQPRTTNDEIGELADSFNQMLKVIQTRDEDLKRTLEELKLRDAELVLARDRAEEGTRAKSEFLAHMSHEIRTPMNGIIGMTQVALKTKLTDSQREYLNAVKLSADSLLLIINEILDFSKIEAGQMELDPVEFDFREVVTGGLKSVALQAHIKDLELGCVVERAVPRLMVGDPARIRQIVINLVGNALKFTKEGSVSLEASVVDDREAGLTLEVRVRDTGIGIPKDRQDKIFESFTQADASTSRNFGGTGLGLTITALLIEMMGGRIWVESVVGRGSTFIFTLNLGKVLESEEDSVEAAARSLVQGREVWAVSENPFHLHALDEYLATLGARVKLFGEPEEALQQKVLPALVFADAEMSTLDGFEFLSRLRSKGVENTCVLLRTSNLSEEITKYRSLGLRGHLIKPLRYRDLVETILRWLDPKTGQRLLGVADTDRQSGKFSIRTLVTDDNEINRQLARIMLEGYGCEVSEAESGEKVLEILGTGVSPDLLFLDIMMPGMDGFECTKRIRELESQSGWERMPIIALTAHALKGYEEKCLAADMDGYLSKPIDEKKMHEVLKRFGTETFEEGVAADKEPPEEESLNADGGQEAEELKVVDLEVALKRVGGNEKILKTIATAFLTSSAKQLDEVEKAVVAGDAEALRFSAHTFKGTVLNFEARRTAKTAQELEDLGRDGSTEGADELIKILRAHYLELRKEMEKLGSAP